MAEQLVVWAIMEDGPLEGLVLEISIAERLLLLTDHGSHSYRRCGWGQSETNHRIAHFVYVKHPASG